jgi:hypothetical protein
MSANLFPEMIADQMHQFELAAMDSWQLARRQTALIKRIADAEKQIERARAELVFIENRHATDESVQGVD